MTHSGGKPHDNVGYRGQRYELHVQDGGYDRRIGWSNDRAGLLRTGQEICASHPAWRNPTVIDLMPDPTITSRLHDADIAGTIEIEGFEHLDIPTSYDPEKQ